MFSTIVSRILFTCSTFLLLSASLLSMEFPGREKKTGGEPAKLPPRSPGEPTEFSWRNEKADARNSDQDLARSLRDCTLSDPTIVRSQGNDSENFALHNEPDSSIDDSMNIIGSGEVGSALTTPIKKRDNSIPLSPAPFVTPAKASDFVGHSFQQIPDAKRGTTTLVTPSPVTPVKRPSFYHLTPSLQQPFDWSDTKIQRVDSPRTAALKIAEHAQRMNMIDQAVERATHFSAYSEAMEEALFPVYRVVHPKDAKKTDPLTQACTSRTAAQRALKTSMENLKHFRFLPAAEQLQMEHSDEELLVKFQLAVEAVQTTTEAMRAAAEGLTSDPQYGLAVEKALAGLRATHASGENLFLAAHTVGLPPPALTVGENLLLSRTDKEEILQKRIQTAEAILQYSTDLIHTVIDKAHNFFQEFRENEEMSQHGAHLQALHQELNAEITLMKVALAQAKQDHSESSPEEGSRLLQALDMTTHNIDQIIEKMRSIVQQANGYDAVTIINVPVLLEQSRELRATYEASLQKLNQ